MVRRDGVEQGGAVVREDVNHRAAVGRLIVDHDARRLLGQGHGGSIAAKAAVPAKQFRHLRLAGENGADRLRHLVDPRSGKIAGIVVVDDLVGIDDNSLQAGADLRRENFQPLGRQRTANAVKAARKILLVRDDAVINRVGHGIVFPFDNHLARLKPGDETQVGGNPLGRRCAEVVRRKRVERGLHPIGRLELPVPGIRRDDVPHVFLDLL